MPVQIDMDMPEKCVDCKYSEKGFELGRIRCRLTYHDFPANDVFLRRFTTCPLKEVKE